MNCRPSCSPLAAAVFIGASFAIAHLGCSGRDHVVLEERAALTGSARLALNVGEAQIDTATLVLSRPGGDGFLPLTRTLDVRGKRGVISVFFGELPAGAGYRLALRSGACSGSADFAIEGGVTTQVEMTLTCGESSAPLSSGAAQSASMIDAGPSSATPREPSRATPREPSRADAGPADAASADAGPAPEPLPASSGSACSICTRSFCAAELSGVNQHLETVAPILACAEGPDWRLGERARAASCANSDVFGCYCGDVPAASCASTPPAEVDGPCRDLLLAGTSCSDSACLKANLLNAQTPAGIGLGYVQCQQDFCYDLCFNP